MASRSGPPLRPTIILPRGNPEATRLAGEIYGFLSAQCDPLSRPAVDASRSDVVGALEKIRPEKLTMVLDAMKWPPLRNGSPLSAMQILKEARTIENLSQTEIRAFRSADMMMEKAAVRAPVAGPAPVPPVIPVSAPAPIQHGQGGMVRTLGAFRAALLKEMVRDGDGGVTLDKLGDKATLDKIMDKPEMQPVLKTAGVSRRSALAALKRLAHPPYRSHVVADNLKKPVTGKTTVSQLVRDFADVRSVP